MYGCPHSETILMSCPIFKFNDYKKKQERGLLITNAAVYNLKGSEVKRRIDADRIEAISFSKIGTEFILHVPSEYDYRYSSTDLRDRIIYFVLKPIVGAKTKRCQSTTEMNSILSSTP